MGGIDDAIKEMELGDLEGAPKMSPIDYAKLRGIYPQKVYTALRNHKLQDSKCDCGRRVVVVEEADEYFKLGRFKEGTVREEGEASEPPSHEPDAG